MRFSVPASDPRIHALVVALDEADAPIAATWRAVGKTAEELGLRRPCYDTVREFVRAEWARKAARAGVRSAALQVAAAAASYRAVDLPIALDALEVARAKKKLVSDRHKPS